MGSTSKIEGNQIPDVPRAAKGWRGVIGVAISDHTRYRSHIVGNDWRGWLCGRRIVYCQSKACRRDPRVACNVSRRGGEFMRPVGE